MGLILVISISQSSKLSAPYEVEYFFKSVDNHLYYVGRGMVTGSYMQCSNVHYVRTVNATYLVEKDRIAVDRPTIIISRICTSTSPSLGSRRLITFQHSSRLAPCFSMSSLAYLSACLVLQPCILHACLLCMLVNALVGR